VMSQSARQTFVAHVHSNSSNAGSVVWFCLVTCGQYTQGHICYFGLERSIRAAALDAMFEYMVDVFVSVFLGQDAVVIVSVSVFVVMTWSHC